jgi:hypothetical protein
MFVSLTKTNTSSEQSYANQINMFVETYYAIRNTYA